MEWSGTFGKKETRPVARVNPSPSPPPGLLPEPPVGHGPPPPMHHLQFATFGRGRTLDFLMGVSRTPGKTDFNSNVMSPLSVGIPTQASRVTTPPSSITTPPARVTTPPSPFETLPSPFSHSRSRTTSGSSARSRTPSGPAESESCEFCNRPPTHIVCRGCGHTFTGRIRSQCSDHPGVIHLMDMQCCPGCKADHLLREFGDPIRKPPQPTTKRTALEELIDTSSSVGHSRNYLQEVRTGHRT